MPTIEDVRNALRTVAEPELHRDLVSLNMVKNIFVEGGKIGLTIELTTPACPMKDEITKRVENALLPLDGVKNVDIEYTARVSHAKPISSRKEIPGVKNVIAVYACKGGVGKSTVSTNLAVSLAKAGARVGLLDADIHGPNIPLMMGIQQQPETSGDNKLTPLQAHGVQLMSLGFLTNVNLPTIWRGPMVHSAVQQLLHDTRWDDLDYLVVDLPPGTGDAPLTIIQTVPLSGVVFVTTPQAVSLADGVKGIGLFKKLEVPLLGMIENMSGFTCPACDHVTHIFSKGGGEKEAKEHDIPFLGAVPLDPTVMAGGDSGKPIVVSHPDAPASQVFMQAARKVAANISMSQRAKDIPALSS